MNDRDTPAELSAAARRLSEMLATRGIAISVARAEELALATERVERMATTVRAAARPPVEP